jgi:hypothetical protein
MKKATTRKSLPAGVAKVLKRLHCPLDVILLCVRWYIAYSLSLRDLEEMMAERGLAVDHSSVHRWVVKLLPLFEKAFRRHKRPVGMADGRDLSQSARPIEYLYRAVDNAGNTIDFLLRAHRGPSVLIATEPILEPITAARLQTQNVCARDRTGQSPEQRPQEREEVRVTPRRC